MLPVPELNNLRFRYRVQADPGPIVPGQPDPMLPVPVLANPILPTPTLANPSCRCRMLPNPHYCPGPRPRSPVSAAESEIAGTDVAEPEVAGPTRLTLVAAAEAARAPTLRLTLPAPRLNFTDAAKTDSPAMASRAKALPMSRCCSFGDGRADDLIEHGLGRWEGEDDQAIDGQFPTYGRREVAEPRDQCRGGGVQRAYVEQPG